MGSRQPGYILALLYSLLILPSGPWIRRPSRCFWQRRTVGGDRTANSSWCHQPGVAMDGVVLPLAIPSLSSFSDVPRQPRSGAESLPSLALPPFSLPTLTSLRASGPLTAPWSPLNHATCSHGCSPWTGSPACRRGGTESRYTGVGGTHLQQPPLLYLD